MVRNLAFNSSYQFRVRARDAAGNWSTWAATSVPYRVTHTSDRSPSVRYSGSGSGAASSSATSDTLMSTTSRGATSLATRSPDRASRWSCHEARRAAWVEVRIDGTYVGKISLWASSLKARQIVFSRAWSTTATRTIELRTVTSSSRKLVSLDAFVVTR